MNSGGVEVLKRILTTAVYYDMPGNERKIED